MPVANGGNAGFETSGGDPTHAESWCGSGLCRHHRQNHQVHFFVDSSLDDRVKASQIHHRSEDQFQGLESQSWSYRYERRQNEGV